MRVDPPRSRLSSDQMKGRDLTVREIEILKLKADGLTVTEIGKVLGTERQTINSQVESIFLKLSAVNTPNAVHIAHQKGWLI